VAAILVHRSIRHRLTCVFVDNGLLREGEFRQVLNTVRDELQLNVVGVEARSRFLDLLAGVEEPERKRKIIGETFIRVFEEECRKLGDVRFLVQGTLYPDVIESVSVKGPSAVIKSHHNVGGLPEEMDLELVEPLRIFSRTRSARSVRSWACPGRSCGDNPFRVPAFRFASWAP
jgi:GMP synthase (glutamine-hydrolysing)